ncbi:MAG: DEAD/DEAH box helicase [Thermoanaerobaculia bacterium]
MTTAAVSVPALVERLREDERLGPEVVYAATLPAEPARTVELDALAEPLPEAVVSALRASGVPRLFSHQAEGLDAVRRGEDVLVTTPTASGKSLVFHLPPLEEAVRGGPGKALYLFPLKALGQDQRGKLEALARGVAEAGGLEPDAARIAVYDGDTPRSERTALRRRPPRVLVTNPDMLHLGILSHWTSWAPFLRDLRWIVLDELHTYRGVFGSHFHHVLQRLLRLAAHEGARPVLVASSATAANAGEFARDLTGRGLRWIERSGAPRAGRHVLLLRPEASPYTTALRLFVELLRSGAKTIVFTKARRITELLYSWLRRQDRELARRVASYRSGFLPEERRRIEGRLFSGELDGVISTSALEMGIDVGGLDACVLVGYPGSVMATWQRSGRAGRGGRESLTALVALPDALDQYFLEHPEELLERPCERLIVDPGNDQVARGHLACAAAELPLRLDGKGASAARSAAEEDPGGGEGAGDAARGGGPGGAEPEGSHPAYPARHRALIQELIGQGHLLASADGGEAYSPRRRPHGQVNLRGTGDTYDVVDARTGELVGTVDGVRVLHECHPGAIYLHGGRQYRVETLDLERRHVLARPGRYDHFTTPLTEKDTEIREVLDRRRDGAGLAAWLGRLRVTERVVGFERKRLQTQEVVGQEALELPPVRFETVGLWWVAPRSFEETLRACQEHFLGALHATEHAAISLFPVLALCDRGDIGGISFHRHPQVETGAVFVYDGHPGGVGIAERGFRELPELLQRVVDLVEGCPCEDGCPSCIQSPKCGNGNRPLDKPGALRVLRMLLDREEPVAAPAGERDVDEVEVVIPPEGDGSSGSSAPSDPVGAELVSAPGPEARSEAESTDEARRAGGDRTEGTGAPPAEPRGRRRAPPLQAPRRSAGTLPVTVLFDLETRRSAREVGGWSNAHRMGIALGVALVLEEGRFQVYREEDAEALGELLASASLVVGFNVKRFDYRVLAGYTGIDYTRVVETLDLLEEVHRRIGLRVGLDHLARETLGAEKSGDGLQCLEWVRQGRLDLVERYCRRDVELLRDLYLHGRREGCVYFRHRERGRIRVPVEW